MPDSSLPSWPIVVYDRLGHRIYITEERWQHALDHPGMHEGLLTAIVETVRTGRRSQDAYDSSKYKYRRAFDTLPGYYTHIVVVVKFGVRAGEPPDDNNFMLTAYLVEKNW